MTYRYEILREKLQERQGAVSQDLDNIEQVIKRHNKNITLMEVEQSMLLQEQIERVVNNTLQLISRVLEC